MNVQTLRVDVVLQDSSGLSCNLWLEVFYELFTVIINEPGQ